MIIDSIINFVDYLNTKEYDIGISDIDKIFLMLPSGKTDVLSDDELLLIMKSVFCKNRKQTESLPEHFYHYINNDRKQKYLTTKSELEKQLDVLLSQKEQEKNELKLSVISEKQINLKASEKKLLEKWKSELKDLMGNDTAQKILDNKCHELQLNVLRQLMTDTMLHSRMYLEHNDGEAFKEWSDIFYIISRAEKNASSDNVAVMKARNELESKYSKSIEEITRKLSKLKADNDVYNIQLQKKLFSLQQVIKERSLHNREEFIGGNRAVKTFSTDVPLKHMNVHFNSLNDEDKRVLFNYIKANLVAFRTRLTRTSMTSDRRNIDMLETIKSACRTGGLPLELYYTKKKPDKTRLILVLDVSGSCSKASEMLLSFIGILNEIFPRQCKAYAFVNRIYDISDIMLANDINDAVRQTLDMIPRSGVYSDYEYPLMQLWNNYRQEITSDSIVIFMGDARNNKNEPAYDYMRNISRRAKKAFWLNTDAKEKWGQGDSIAHGYARYSSMMECRTPQDLIDFVWRLL